jgi:hypothetical protein
VDPQDSHRTLGVEDRPDAVLLFVSRALGYVSKAQNDSDRLAVQQKIAALEQA